MTEQEASETLANAVFMEFGYITIRVPTKMVPGSIYRTNQGNDTETALKVTGNSSYEEFKAQLNRGAALSGWEPLIVADLPGFKYYRAVPTD